MLIISSLNDASRLNSFKRVNQIFIQIYHSNNKNILPVIDEDNLEKPLFVEVSNKGEIISTQIIDSENYEIIYDYLDAISGEVK